MYDLRSTKLYRKSFKRVVGHKDFDQELLDEVVDTLRLGGVLPTKFRDHELKGEYRGCRECHIKSDILLVYQKQNDVLVLLLVDIGSHSSLFG